MTELTSLLRELPAQVLEHQYSYSHFGSWWVTVLRKGATFRFVFDGKDGKLVFERGGEHGRPKDWDVLETWTKAAGDEAQVVREIVDRIRAV